MTSFSRRLARLSCWHLLLASSLLVTPVMAAPAANRLAPTPAPGKAERQSPLVDSSFRLRKMPNGMDLVTVPSPKVPLVTIVLVAKAGAMTETKDISGLTHLWEHMFFKGNQRLSNQEAFMNRVRDLGIVFNGDTSAEVVRYYFTLPSAFLEEGLQFMSDAISTPLLEQGELEKERKVVLDEYDRDASSPGFDRYNLTRKLQFGPEEHRRNPLGVRKVIETATREQLLRIKTEVFVPANCALLVGGDFDQSRIQSQVEKYFSGWTTPAGWKPVARPVMPKLTATSDFVMTRPKVENADISLSFSGPLASKDVKDTYAGDILGRMLGHKNGRFYKKFIDSGLTFGAGAGYYTQADAGDISVNASTTPEKAQKVLSALLEEIPEMRRPGYFTREQLEDAKRSFAIERKFDLNKISEHTKSLAFWWAVTGLDYYGSYLVHLNAVRMSDVQAFIGKWMYKKPHIASIFMSPEAAVKVGLKDNSAPLMEKFSR
ncbi:MAG: hypothetical protein RIQ81_1191 [Pseudomonadota bacterium]|jgi:zinc protease